MSRSNPTDRSSNPSARWFEWDGAHGGISYYDKQTKQNVEVGDKFTFILLDELATIKGWHDSSESGIFSNEVRDTVAEPFVVKSFKGGQIAQGFYRQIRDRVHAAGGKFVTNCYIAFRPSAEELVIGSLQLKGSALNAWVDFKKANRSEIYKKSVQINGSTEGKKGSIKFHVPKFVIRDITEETNTQAMTLDGQLQEFLKGYFARTRSEQVVAPQDSPTEEAYSQERTEREPAELHRHAPDPDLDAPEDDIPF